MSSEIPSGTDSESVFGIASEGGTNKTLNLSSSPTSRFEYNSTRGHTHLSRSLISTAPTTTTCIAADAAASATQRQIASSTGVRYRQQVETKQTPQRYHQRYQQQGEQVRMNLRASEEAPASYRQSHALGYYPPAVTDAIFSDHHHTISNQHTENLQSLVQLSILDRSPCRSKQFSDSGAVPNVGPLACDIDVQSNFDIEIGDTGTDQPVSFSSVTSFPHFQTSSKNRQPRSIKSEKVALEGQPYTRNHKNGKPKQNVVGQEPKWFQRQRRRQKQEQEQEKAQQQVPHLDSNRIQLFHQSAVVPVSGLTTPVQNEETEESNEIEGGSRPVGRGNDNEKITGKNDDYAQLPRRQSKGVAYKTGGKNSNRSFSPVPGVSQDLSLMASIASNYFQGSFPFVDESRGQVVPPYSGDRDREEDPASNPLPLTVRGRFDASRTHPCLTYPSRDRAEVGASTSSVSPPSSFSSVSTSAGPSTTQLRHRAPLPLAAKAVPPPSTSLLPPLPFDSVRGDQSEHFHSKPQSSKAGSTSIDAASTSIYKSPQTGSTEVSISRTDTNSFRSTSRESLLSKRRTTWKPKYFRVLSGGQNCFPIRSKSDQNREQGEHKSKQAKVNVKPPLDAVPPSTLLESVDPSTANFGTAREDTIFGTQEQVEERERRLSDIRPSEQILINFLKKMFGSRAEKLAIGLMNRSPITSPSNFVYRICQGTEDSDLSIIRRDLDPDILFKKGVRLLGGGWSNLLLGNRFAPERSTRQRHELTYCRSDCSCLTCLVRKAEAAQEAPSDVSSAHGESNGTDSLRASSMDRPSSTSTDRTPLHSAKANFVELYELPINPRLLKIAGRTTPKELEIGSVIRLNLRNSAKLKFTGDIRKLFGHLAYTGPISHGDVVRKVTTIGVKYYTFNKGKKERKVFIKGKLITIPINMGVAKLGTQPLFRTELGSTFLLYRKQQLSIYVGELVLEGNSIGSFINTGLRYYIGFGEERGVCPVYPNKDVGKARTLGINELLLHHHMVDDLEIKCL